MQLMINGVNYELDASNLKEVVAHFGLSGKPIIVEAAGQIVKPECWEETLVNEGMMIELVHFVGGG